MAVDASPASRNDAPQTERTDTWWLEPLKFFLLFSAFGIWATLRALQNAHYEIGPYLSPFYAPTIDIHKMGVPKLGGVFAISPALIILPFPLLFRLTCYYYRKMIYRSYLADPTACAVREPAILEKMRYKKYTGERAFPFIAMNFHRFAFYFAVLFIVLLWYDAFKTLYHDGHFRIGLGTLVYFVNVILLSLYTFSCHSWRHLIGGGTDCYSCDVMSKTRHGLWTKVSFLNEKHGQWAMLSLVSVALTDAYTLVVSLSMGGNWVSGSWL